MEVPLLLELAANVSGFAGSCTIELLDGSVCGCGDSGAWTRAEDDSCAIEAGVGSRNGSVGDNALVGCAGSTNAAVCCPNGVICSVGATT